MTDKEIIARQAEKIIELEDRIREIESDSIPVKKFYIDDFSEVYIKAKMKTDSRGRM